MSKFEVVCTEDSLLGFFDDYLTNLGKPEESYENLVISLSWKKLLFKDAYLILDMTDDRYEELVKNDSMFLLLEKSCQGGGSKVSASPGILDEYEKEGSFGEFLSPIFIGESLKKEYELKYGRLIFPQSEMHNIGELIFNHGMYIIREKEQERDVLSSWNDLEIVSLPFSDIVLIDNFIVNDGGIMNIIKLLKGLIPKKQEKSKINLTIITAFFKDPQPTIEEKTDRWYSKLSQTLKSTFTKFSFDLSVAVISQIRLLSLIHI